MNGKDMIKALGEANTSLKDLQEMLEKSIENTDKAILIAEKATKNTIFWRKAFFLSIGLLIVFSIFYFQ